MATERAVHLEIRGRVQGVFFRASARERAKELGLRGWVRNLPDGSVESVACGEDAAVEDFIDWCRTGSTAAKVDRVVVEPAAEAVQGTDFEIRR